MANRYDVLFMARMLGVKLPAPVLFTAGVASWEDARTSVERAMVDPIANGRAQGRIQALIEQLPAEVA